MEIQEIRKRIDSFPRWHYQFNLRGILTPVFDEAHTINRHRQRKKLFFDPLLELFGGSLEGKRILDLGCNAGFWSLCAIQSGCDFVLGIDGRQMHIDQADFVFQVKEIEEPRYKFIARNLYDFDFQQFGDFDIVFCLGLMYHISKPMVLVEKIAQVNNDVLIIDTRLSNSPGSFMEICRDNLNEPRHSVDYELVMVPTRQAVVELVQQFGYSLRVLKPQFQDYTGCESYQLGRRRAFLCAKKTNLSNLSVEVEPIDTGMRKTNHINILKQVVSKIARFTKKLNRL